MKDQAKTAGPVVTVRGDAEQPLGVQAALGPQSGPGQELSRGRDNGQSFGPAELQDWEDVRTFDRAEPEAETAQENWNTLKSPIMAVYDHDLPALGDQPPNPLEPIDCQPSGRSVWPIPTTELFQTGQGQSRHLHLPLKGSGLPSRRPGQQGEVLTKATPFLGADDRPK